jgi:hypothetical protein
MSRPSLYHYVTVLSRSHDDTQFDTRRALENTGFEGAYQNPNAWEHFAFNADTLVVVTNVPLSPGQTYVHVIATSNTDGSAAYWSIQLMEWIKAQGRPPDIDHV